ncbi:MAG TPA: tetratricopeptide repeat protein, partial [Chitinophagaceae bacterium]|nr:tetratricopeptide repeat protein [Chitinophagaceae bacterium]
YLKLNDLDKAIDYCKQSLKITQSTGDKKGEANTLLHLAEIFQQAGDIGQAAKFSNESLEIRKARGDRRGEAEVLLFLADLYKDGRDTEDHQIFQWLSGALKIADETKAQDLLSKAYYDLHQYYSQKGNHRESLIQLEAHLQIEKELHKNTINQKISNLEISHKAEVISQRNKELIELNEKIEKSNAELKIEASLERVRTVAMGMKKPDDLLSICEILYTEFQSLGFTELRNTMIDIYKDDKGSFLNYDFSGNVGSSIINFPIHDCHPVIEKFTIQIRKSGDAFAEIALSGKELESWKEFRKTNGELFDPKLEKSDVLYYYFYSVGIDALGISTFKPVSARELDILKRFRNVFDLAYRRYTDIEKAEAQAKESKIELALERVRAKTMAMHKSEEVTGVAVSLNEELLKLGFEGGSTIIIMDKETGGTEQWT